MSPTDIEFAILDVETTGIYAKTDRILEIAVIRVGANGTIAHRFETLLNPGRDVGPTDIHGISASDVVDAPRFELIAGTIFRLLADSLIVGHNVRFDLGFLAQEATRVGWSLPPAPWVDTMALSGLAGFTENGRSLVACCAAAGVQVSSAHRALHDAEATAQLLVRCLETAPDAVSPRVRGLMGAPRALWPMTAVDAAPVCRTKAMRLAERRYSYLGRIVARLPGELACDDNEGVTAYYALLDRALEDRLVSDGEADALFELAMEWGLSAAQVRRAHRTYLDGLLCAALRDGELTAAELSDLRQTSLLLGVDEGALERNINAARSATQRNVGKVGSPQPPRAEQHDWKGQRVCFTGELRCTLAGEKISRAKAEELAEAAGLDATSGVTKTTDILVVADPETMSSKARKAREYGTRIVAEHLFWKMIHVEVD